MEIYQPFSVYTNLVKMLSYRGAILRGSVLTEDQLVERLNHYEFITLIADRTDTHILGKAICYILLIKPGSKYSAKTSDFKKLLKEIPSNTLKNPQPIEVMFVSENVFTIHIKKALVAWKSENHISGMYIEDHDYEKWYIETPKHVSVPKHTIATPDEIAKFCALYYVSSPDKFPKILVNDVQAVWLGLKPGMVCKIIRVSESAGESIAYRYCIRG